MQEYMVIDEERGDVDVQHRHDSVGHLISPICIVTLSLDEVVERSRTLNEIQEQSEPASPGVVCHDLYLIRRYN